MNLQKNTKRIFIENPSSKTDLVLNQGQKDLIVGTLLGDGNLQTFSSTGSTWRYRALQKKTHEPYLLHKYGKLKSFCGSPPIYSEVYDDRTQKTYKRYYFNTLTFQGFMPYARAFYLFDGSTGLWVKDVPENIHEI